MKKRSKMSKIGFIFAILLLALTGISISYAGLTDTINIFGTVTTAEEFVTICGSNQTAWARMYDDPNDFTYPFPGANWATYVICTPTEEIQTFYLYAGQHYRVGELNIWNNSNSLFVQFDLDEDFAMEKNHLHIATSLNGIPQSPGGPIPGLFAHNREYDPYQQQDTYQIAWNPSWNNIPLYIAAHSDVWGYY